MMRRIFAGIFIVLITLTTAGHGAAADSIKFRPDPVYKKIAEEDPHPMDEMIAMAKDGDVRAQFILGDLYAKGKGGLGQDVKQAAKWFEESAKQGYGPAFIRLAALSKNAKEPLTAYKWYTLGLPRLDSDGRKWAIAARKTLAEEKKLGRDGTKKAEDAARDWEKNLKQEQQAREKEARAEAEAAKKAAAAKPQKPKDKDKKEEKKEKDKKKSAAAEKAVDTKNVSKPAEKEIRYND